MNTATDNSRNDFNATHRAYFEVTHFSPEADAIVTTRFACYAWLTSNLNGFVGNGSDSDTVVRKMNIGHNDKLRLTKYMVAEIANIPARYIASHEGYLKSR